MPKVEVVLIVCLFLCVSCAKVGSQATERVSEDGKHVLVVMNSASEASTEIAAYYRQKREIPKENVVLINCVTTDNIPIDDFAKHIEQPIRKAVKESKYRIDYIVLTKGIPIRLNDDGGFAVDAFLATTNMNLKPIQAPTEAEVRRCVNPYFEHEERFASDKFDGLLLVTRLDGPKTSDALKLVDNSILAKPENGPFFFDQAGNRKTEGYKLLNDALATASEELRKRKFQSALDSTDSFIAPDEQLMGYCSWGSNDSSYDMQTYHKLKFKPGAIAETFVSTSGRTFSYVKGGQSQITDLIDQGVTGVKGYVSEPYTFALARPDILFDRYTKGFNLAESFYMSSLVIKWKDIIIGDPLCRPYVK